MTKVEALTTLMREARSMRLTKTSLNRLRSACKALGLSEEDTRLIEINWGYRTKEGELYPQFK